MNRPASFEYRYQDWPSLPVQIENQINRSWVIARITLDTGADATILDERFGRHLGLDLVRSESLDIRGFGGRITGRPGVVDIGPLGRRDLMVRLEAVFVEGVSAQVGSVLGLDYFASFDLILSHANNMVSLRPA